MSSFLEFDRSSLCLSASVVDFFLLQILENTGRAHASADAHGDHAVAGLAAPQFADDARGELGAGASQRMTEGDRSAVRVNECRVEAAFLDDGQRLRGEGFVQLDDADVARA